jgi:hypothetical protein
MLLSVDERQNSLAFEANGTSGNQSSDFADTDSAVPAHPLGIKPLGNRYFWDGPVARDATGVFQLLPDEMLVQLLEFLDPRSLRFLGYTCKYLFAHCISEELWKGLFLEYVVPLHCPSKNLLMFPNKPPPVRHMTPPGVQRQESHEKQLQCSPCQVKKHCFFDILA